MTNPHRIITNSALCSSLLWFYSPQLLWFTLSALISLVSSSSTRAVPIPIPVSELSSIQYKMRNWVSVSTPVYTLLQYHTLLASKKINLFHRKSAFLRCSKTVSYTHPTSCAVLPPWMYYGCHWQLLFQSGEEELISRNCIHFVIWSMHSRHACYA